MFLMLIFFHQRLKVNYFHCIDKKKKKKNTQNKESHSFDKTKLMTDILFLAELSINFLYFRIPKFHEQCCF